MTLAKSYERSFVITHSKSLQDQYAGDFDDLVPVKGKSNFPCFKSMEAKGIDLQEYSAAMSQGLTCYSGECIEKTSEGTRNCKFKPTIQSYASGTFDEIICPYYEKKYEALISNHSLWNYSSYFQIVKYNKDMYSEYLTRNISIFDEAHSIEDQIIKFVGIVIGKRHVDECNIEIGSYDLSDIDMIVLLLRNMADFYDQKLQNIRQDRSYHENPNYSLVSRLVGNRDTFSRHAYEISSDPDNFIINRPNLKNDKFKSVVIKPLDISRYVREFFITPFQIFVSATINKDAFCQNMGFDPDEVALVDTPRSPFAPGNRRVEFLNTARLSYLDSKVIENRLWLKIDELLTRHKNQRGLILTSSVRRCIDIAENLSSQNRSRVRICHAKNPGEKTQADVIREHANSKDGVLVSSSLWQGVDLKDDLSRFQIIAKAPYPVYTENWVEAKMERYPLWYTSYTITKILQGFGRSVRSEQDWAVTYVLDSAIQPLLENSRNLVPKSYHDVLGWENTTP